MMVSIEVNQQQIDSVHQLLNEVKNGAAKAIRTSLNRTLTGAKTVVTKEMGKKVTLKAKKMKSLMVEDKATLAKFSAKLRIRGESIPLAAFKTTPVAANFQSMDRNSNGVLVKVWKDKPSIRLRHAFFARLQSGHIGLFLRRDLGGGVVAGRLPIDEQFGPPLTSVYTETTGLAAVVENTSADRLQRELASQVDFLLSKT